MPKTTEFKLSPRHSLNAAAENSIGMTNSLRLMPVESHIAPSVRWSDILATFLPCESKLCFAGILCRVTGDRDS